MSLQEYRVWDRSTRLFHWINVLCVLGLLAIGTVILNAKALGVTDAGKILLKTAHVYVGYAFALNLLWRLLWAFVGGAYARWRSILPGGPGYGSELKAELSALAGGRPLHYLGHSPLGRIAVTVMLLALAVQAASGLVLAGTDVYMPPFGQYFADSVKAPGLDADQVRPYAPETVDPAAYQQMRDVRAPAIAVHERLFLVILALIVLHVAAVVTKEVRGGGNLVSAMFTGRKAFASPPRDAANAHAADDQPSGV